MDTGSNCSRSPRKAEQPAGRQAEGTREPVASPHCPFLRGGRSGASLIGRAEHSRRRVSPRITKSAAKLRMSALEMRTYARQSESF